MTDYMKLHLNAVLYRLAVQETEPSTEHLGVITGLEVSDAAGAKLDRHYHVAVFPSPRSEEITVLAGDGHEKVATKITVEHIQQRALLKKNAALKAAMSKSEKAH